MAADIVAPMVGKIVKILVEVGQEVSEDEPVLMLEAMKVEMPVVAPEDGKVSEILVQEGATVEGNQLLLKLA
ncbi:MAG: acetyl-CoA carboxylase biotin carboxyl carrier protein subunit [Proteobacteria bacterium]|jgi:biotin carboxyl carrier protein|nr:acetyl-CoA carboxylase biotin carboxyl carrier protein subunit [Pseudomonadota bacterium]